MSEDFVTRAELEAFERKVERQLQTFMAEGRAQGAAIEVALQAGMQTVGREAREARAEILDSNRSLGERIVVCIQNSDRASADIVRSTSEVILIKKQYDRAANALAARVGNLEKTCRRIEQVLSGKTERKGKVPK